MFYGLRQNGAQPVQGAARSATDAGDQAVVNDSPAGGGYGLGAGGSGVSLPGYTPMRIPAGPDFAAAGAVSRNINAERPPATSAPWYGQPSTAVPNGGSGVPDDFWDEFDARYGDLLNRALGPAPGTLEHAQGLVNSGYDGVF